MGPETMAALIGGGASIGGTMLSNQASSAASKKQMQFQRYMSNTAYQRAAKDLQKAGLNRILALGSPASTPAGAQPNIHNLGPALAQGATAAVGVQSAKADVKLKQKALGPASLEEQISKDAMKFMNAPENKKYKDAFLGAMLAKKAGLPSWSGLVPAGESVARDLKPPGWGKNKDVVEQLKKDAEKRREAMKKDSRYYDKSGKYKPGSIFEFDNLWPKRR